jgi:hypothetical protein
MEANQVKASTISYHAIGSHTVNMGIKKAG